MHETDADADTDTDQYVHVAAPQSSPVGPPCWKSLPQSLPSDQNGAGPARGPPAAEPVASPPALPAATAVAGTGSSGHGNGNGWGDLTDELLRQDLGRAERLRDRHLRGARVLSAVSWALCSLGALSAVLCILSDVLFRSTVATGVLAGISGACNALQRVPGPGEASARLYDLATRADTAAARIASILDTPRPARGDAATTLAQVNALVGAAQAPTCPRTTTPLTTTAPLSTVTARQT